MNIIIYTLLILTILYFLIKWWRGVFSKKMSKSVRLFTIFILIILAIIFAVGGKILLNTTFNTFKFSPCKTKRVVNFSIIFII
jgi:hypothetical protein